MLKFKISQVVSHLTKYGQDFLDPAVFDYLPDLRKLGFGNITEDELYQLLGLTQMEIQQINSFK